MSISGRIAVARQFGAPEVIALEEHPSPELRSGEIRIAVRSAGINPVDARIRSGSFGGSVPLVLGTEFAGIVIESREHTVKQGEEVIGWGVQGSNGDLVVTDASRIARKPEGLDWHVAAGIGGVGNTAMTALAALRLQAGDTIVVHGAAGGVGTILVQLAQARELNVIGTASEPNHAHLRELGANPIAYGEGLAVRIAEAAGASKIVASIDLAGSAEAGDFAAELRAAGGQAITLVPETARSHGIDLVRSQRTCAQLNELVDLLVSGALVAPTEALPFTQIVEAHRRMDASHGRGKLVLDLADNPHFTDLAKEY